MDIAGLDFNNPASFYADNIRLTSTPAVHSPDKFAEALKRASANSTVVEKRAGEEPIDKEDKLYQLCLELETFLVKNLLTSMRNTVQKSGLVDNSFAGKMYEDMLYDEYAKDYTKSANFGLAEQAYRQLKRING
ncbi:rod-binding protein [Treponema sp. R80B11-R83G3]